MRSVPETLRTVRLRAIAYAAPDVMSFEFVPVDGLALPDYGPGAHLDLHLPDGQVRQYSLTNAAGEGRYIVGVARARAGRGGSAFLHDKARPGELFQVSEPRNAFALDEHAPASVLIAGGIGITPMVAMARRLGRLGRVFTLHYAARSREAAAFLPELEAVGCDLRLHADDVEAGLLDVAAIVRGASAGTHLYCCGPAPMLAAFREAADGRDPATVHFEAFDPVAPAADDEGLVIELARTGGLIVVRPDQTILEALEAAGASVSSSCRNGVCGTCEVRVLAGEPDHRDLILSEAEKARGDTMMICCSRAKTPRLRLDL